MTPWLLDPSIYHTILLWSFAYVALILIAGIFFKSPYGRFADNRYGISLNPRVGWFLMELPATISFIFFYLQGQNAFETVPLLFLGVWLIHYSNRGFIFPFLIRVAKGQKGSFSLSIVAAGWMVTTLHGYLNAVFISHLGEHFTNAWLTDPRFLIGITLYIFGLTLNIHSDYIIRNLRSKKEIETGEKIYRIPKGGLFRYVSSPSYLTEIISFTGFAIATWSLGALFVLAVTMANLIPRAIQTHQWYKEKFADYPSNRKILIPGIW